MNVRQFLKLIAIVGSGYLLCYGALYALSDPLALFVDDMLGMILVLAPVVVAMSFAMFTYVDNLAKELTDLRNDFNREAYLLAQGGIAALKKEILLNAGFVICLCIIERATKSFAVFFLVSASSNQIWLLTTIFLSLRSGLFFAAIWATISQLKGFVVAVEYRTLIACNRK